MNTLSKIVKAITLVVVSAPSIASSNSEVWISGNGSVWTDRDGNPIRTIYYNDSKHLVQAYGLKPKTPQVIAPKLTSIKIEKAMLKDKEKGQSKKIIKVLPPKFPNKKNDEYTFKHYQSTVLFETDSAVLSEEAMDNLGQLAIVQMLAQNVVSVQVVGHADTRGGEAYNMGLSARRMHAVAQWLSGLKLKVTSMFAKGETSPVLNNLGEDLAKSRRVDLSVKVRYLKD